METQANVPPSLLEMDFPKKKKKEKLTHSSQALCFQGQGGPSHSRSSTECSQWHLKDLCVITRYSEVLSFLCLRGNISLNYDPPPFYPRLFSCWNALLPFCFFLPVKKERKRISCSCDMDINTTTLQRFLLFVSTAVYFYEVVGHILSGKVFLSLH